MRHRTYIVVLSPEWVFAVASHLLRRLKESLACRYAFAQHTQIHMKYTE